MIDDSATTDARLGGRNIYTAGDWARATDITKPVTKWEVWRRLGRDEVLIQRCPSYGSALRWLDELNDHAWEFMGAEFFLVEVVEVRRRVLDPPRCPNGSEPGPLACPVPDCPCTKRGAA
jgi:hypothetical protein